MVKIVKFWVQILGSLACSPSVSRTLTLLEVLGTLSELVDKRPPEGTLETNPKQSRKTGVLGDEGNAPSPKRS